MKERINRLKEVLKGIQYIRNIYKQKQAFKGVCKKIVQLKYFLVNIKNRTFMADIDLDCHQKYLKRFLVIKNKYMKFRPHLETEK